MLFRESAESVSVDQAWSDLRHHLDWTKGEPTIVFLAAQSHDQVDDLRERTVLWCRRNRERWTLYEPDAGSVDWLRRELPRSGVLWLDLWEEGRRTEVLHALNELRIRLSCSGGSCLVICGPVPLLGESAYEAADLWSVRSFAHVVRAVLTPPGAPHPATENVEWKPEILGGEGYRSTWRLTVPDQLRTPEAGVALQEVGRARSLLPADPVGARRVLDDSRISDSPIRRIVFGLTRAEIAGLLGDGIGAEANLASVMVGLRGLPRSFRADAADAVMQVGEFFGAYDAAAEAAEESLGIAREVSEELATPESRRDLAISLDNVGRVAEQRGDLEAADRYYKESVTILREIAELVGTPQAIEDLVLALGIRVRIAAELGGSALAEQLEAEPSNLEEIVVENRS